MPVRNISTLHHSLLLLAALTFGHIDAANAQTWKEIRFGVEAEVPPFESRNAKGELVGLDIELGDALCAQMKVKCRWVDQPYAGNIAALKARRFDLIVGMTPTAKRKEQIDFTDVMYELSSRLVTRRGTDLQPTTASLKGKRVGVLRGTSREAFALAQWAPAGVQVDSFDLNAELIRSLQAGRIDATLQDTVEISHALLDTPDGRNFSFSGPAVTDPLLGSGIAMGVRKDDPELKAMLNRAIAALKANSVLRAITSRYLPAPSLSDATTPPSRAPLRYFGTEGGRPFSQAVRAGNMLYLSGILGDDANGKFAKGTAAQTTAIMDNIRTVLEENGSSLDRVVQCKVILADINDFADMNKVYSRYFPAGRFPARTTFQAARLVADAAVEIECMADVE
ncbi:transporter substrate-binding domain-containing protein [Herbaspirillum rhizosphaerae]|uniref:transporter substrate-binding domain-containing protein n=1 Tax=Herbaspirillum rhizosphaerae TaxID=346179 RepID=UPI00067C9BE6|nr:transporter substrate-binding domain-containing protein [Herbaspirillum rhizosphaerae]